MAVALLCCDAPRRWLLPPLQRPTAAITRERARDPGANPSPGTPPTLPSRAQGSGAHVAWDREQRCMAVLSDLELPQAACRPRVLVCAPSNAATDELCERILKVRAF